MSRSMKEAAVLREVELLWQALDEEKRVVQQKQAEIDTLGVQLLSRDAALAAAQKEIDYLSAVLHEADAKRADDVEKYAALLQEREAAVEQLAAELDGAHKKLQRMAVALNNAEAELARDKIRCAAAEAEAAQMELALRSVAEFSHEARRVVVSDEREMRECLADAEAQARFAFGVTSSFIQEMGRSVTTVDESAKARINAALAEARGIRRQAERCGEVARSYVAESTFAARAVIQDMSDGFYSMTAGAWRAVAAEGLSQASGRKKQQWAWQRFESWLSSFANSALDAFIDIAEIAVMHICKTFLEQRATAENVFKQLTAFKKHQQQSFGYRQLAAKADSSGLEDDDGGHVLVAADTALQARLVALQDRFLQSQRMLQFSNRRVEELEVKLAEMEREQRSSHLLQPLTAAALHQDPADGDDSSARSNAVSILRHQLDSQAQVLSLLEKSEREAACARSSAALAHALTAALCRLADEALATYAEDLDRFSNDFELERLQLRTTMEAASEQHRAMAEHQERMARLLGSDSLSADVRDDVKFRTKFLDVLCDSGSQFSEVVLMDFLLDFKAQLAAVMFLESLGVLSAAFVGLAPRNKTSTHLRVHVLEGALNLAEAQRDQCSMVANWANAECEKAAQALADLLSRTNAAIQSDERGMATAQTAAHTGGVSEGAKLLAAQLQMEDARIAGEAQSFRLLCERFLSGVENLHCRLLQSEIALGSTQASAREKEAAAAECLQQMDHARISQFVEREIADDALLCLREHLRMERQVGLHSMRALTVGNEERNVCILQLQQDVSSRALQCHCLHLMAQYFEGAFECTLGNLYALGRDCLTYVRAKATDRVTEVGFTFHVVHFELGQALVLGHRSTLDVFRDFDVLLRRIIDEKYVLRQKLVEAGDHTMQLLHERRLERASAAWLSKHMFDAVAMHALASHAESCALLSEAMQSLLVYGHKYAAVAMERDHDARRIAELELTVVGLEAAVDEHKMALAASSATSVSVQRVLEDKLAALRLLEERLSTALAELDEARMAQKRQEEQIKFLHKKVQSESDALKESRARTEELQQRHNNVAQLQADVERLEQAVVAEREAHRNTIRSFSNQGR